MKTIRDSRKPSVIAIRMLTETTAISMWKQQFVGFFGRGLAVVAGDVHCDIGGDDAALQGLDALQHVVGDDDGVGALALGHRDGHRGQELAASRRAPCARTAVGSSPPSITSATLRTKTGPIVRTRPPPRCARPRRCAGTRRFRAGTRGWRYRTGRRAAGGWRARARPPPARARGCSRPAWPASSTMRISRRCPPIRVTAETSGTCLMASCDLGGDAAQFEIAVALAGKGQGQDRHVVDGARLDQRRGGARAGSGRRLA